MTFKDNGLAAFRISVLAAAVAASGHVLAQDDESVTELGEIEVTAEKEGPQGPDYGYQAERSLTATKTDTPLAETPRSVSVATRERIEDQNAQTLSDILYYMPGVSSTKFPVGDGLAGDIFYIRGMNQRDYGYGTYRDGLRVQPNAYSTSAEPFGLERVEVFKGPTSVLYGENVPGGLVNLVSKRPTESNQGQVNLSYGTHDRKQVSADVSGAMTDDGKVLGRMVFLRRQSDTQTDSVPDDRFYFAPSMTVKLTDQDTLTLLASYQKDDTEIQLGLPAAGTVLDHPSGQLDPSTNLGHPEWDTFDREVWSLGYEYEHEFNSDLTFRQNARYLRSRVERKEVWWSFPRPGQQPGINGDGFDDFVGAYGRDRFNESRTYSIDNQLVGDVHLGVTENTWLAGVSFDRTSFDQTQRVGGGRAINIFDPVWSSIPDTPDEPSSDAEETQNLVGAYAQVQSRVGNLIGLLGGRFDYAETEFENRRPNGDDFDFSDKEFTWQAGLMYEFGFGLSPYLSYSTSFVPARQVSASDEPLEPITGRQYEVGFKYQPPGSDTLVTVSAFDIVKEDDVNFDLSTAAYRNVGRTESEGVEFELNSDINENLSLLATYTYTDAKIVEDESFPRYEGKQVVGVPRNQASLWANYKFFEEVLRGVEAGVGVRYVGESFAYPDSGLAYPSRLETDEVTLVDLALAYEFLNGWETRLNVHNLFDEEYVGECNNASRCYYGAERTVQGTVSYNW
ncbi:TonB-dependent siderophore receptor [Marinobacter sp. 71-i]|uniref:TonB-dependent siderophore receptor n=1 Tax=Marinobacter iranensis TaxID=2962607 RepID=A0ABT5YDW4_9GAMM|nr:TonB-dependent siderophore receptor [Marinobacter iranensis]MDF0751853.1 TonB-dependent siderophore receptor [Marinobacter iranensis]